MSKSKLTRVLMLISVPALLLGCGADPVSFSEDVQPILEEHCISCHQPGGSGFEASGLSMVSYEALMKGTEGGAMVIPGDVEGSNLVVLMEGRADPSISMPHGSMDPVPSEQIAVIKQWIAEGARKN